MTQQSSKATLPLVVLTAVAVVVTAIIALNMQHQFDGALPMAIIAAAGLLGLGLAARR